MGYSLAISFLVLASVGWNTHVSGQSGASTMQPQHPNYTHYLADEIRFLLRDYLKSGVEVTVSGKAITVSGTVHLLADLNVLYTITSKYLDNVTTDVNLEAKYAALNRQLIQSSLYINRGIRVSVEGNDVILFGNVDSVDSETRAILGASRIIYPNCIHRSTVCKKISKIISKIEVRAPSLTVPRFVVDVRLVEAEKRSVAADRTMNPVDRQNILSVFGIVRNAAVSIREGLAEGRSRLVGETELYMSEGEARTFLLEDFFPPSRMPASLRSQGGIQIRLTPYKFGGRGITLDFQLRSKPPFRSQVSSRFVLHDRQGLGIYDLHLQTPLGSLAGKKLSLFLTPSLLDERARIKRKFRIQDE